ncbi:hypothetical protein RB653_005791 [Dictyostelium firmibasis]|uniref:RabGAP/TBC domain-containing protein n=1 Tax=Dictyostelium firmibasis TaxID=79012 RepID=A0AAN7U7V6_9MYCE
MSYTLLPTDNNMTVSTSTPIKSNSNNRNNSNSNSNNNNNNNNNNNGNGKMVDNSTPIKKPIRDRQLFSFSELAGTNLTLLLESDILLRIFSKLEYSDLFIVKRVCSRWKPLCEHKSLFTNLDMQSFILYCRILPMIVLNNFLQTLSMDRDEIDALKMVCREMPKINFNITNTNTNTDININGLDALSISKQQQQQQQNSSNIPYITTTTTTTTTTTINTSNSSNTATTFITNTPIGGSTTPPIKNSFVSAFTATTSSLKSFLNTSGSGIATSLNGSNGSLSTPPSPNLTSNNNNNNNSNINNNSNNNSLNSNNSNSNSQNGHLRVSSLDDTLSVSSTSSNGSLSSLDSLAVNNNSSGQQQSINTPTSSRRNVFGQTLTLGEKEQKKKDKNRKEREKRMEESLKIWNEDMVPNWEKRKGTKKCREMVLQGIPSLVRSKVWPLLIGNDLNITPELFSIFGARAERAKQKSEAKSLGREKTVSLIHLDLPRTFPMLSIFQDEGPLHQSLANVLEAYVCYRPDVGYVQGMSYLAAVFLLILDEFSSFVCLSNFLNNPCYMSFYTMNLDQMAVYMSTMDQLMAQNLPRIQKHLKELGIQPDIFMIDWVLTVFSKALPLDVASHVWDTIFLDGEIVIFQTALGILKMYSKDLEFGDFDVCMTLLTHLPTDIDEDELFQHINSFQINQKQLNKMLNN